MILRGDKSNGADRRQRGAAAVEMALVAPFLLLLLLGIIEFGYLFGQYNEIRHAVRETARYAAVSNPDRTADGVVDNDDVIDVACDSLNLPGGTFDLSVTTSDTNGDGTVGSLGDIGVVTITATIAPLSGAPLISSFLPTTLVNSAEFRLERDALWTTPVTGTALSC